MHETVNKIRENIMARINILVFICFSSF